MTKINLYIETSYDQLDRTIIFHNKRRAGILPNIQFRKTLLFLFSAHDPQTAGITEIKSEYRLLSICYQITFSKLRNGVFKPFFVLFSLFQLNFESAAGHEPATISPYLRIILTRFYVSYTSFKSWCTQFVPIMIILMRRRRLSG